MNILITGGTGFIGSRLALRCISRGDTVRVLGQENTDAEKENNKLIQKQGIEVIIGSLSDNNSLNKAVQNVDIVFHLAAAQHEMNIPDQKFWDVNVTGTKNLLEAAISSNIKRFVYGSTIGVYGSMNGNIDESSSCKPANIYGKTKLEAEELVLSYNSKLPTVAVRIPETYGPGDRRLLKLFKGIKKNMFFIIGNGKNLHHLIFIEDLINGFFLAASKDEALGNVFLMGGPKPLTTNEMVKTIADSLNAKIPKLHIPLSPMLFTATFMEFILRPLGIQPPLHRRRIDFFRKSFSLSTDKARNLLGFKPIIDFRKGVDETRKWYEEMKLI